MPDRTRVLIIDAEVLVQNLVGALLEGDGFEVFSALSGVQGIELVLHANPEAVVLDVSLPDMDAYELGRRLRERTDAVIIFVGDKHGIEDVVRAMQLGADDYLAKPFAYEEFIARLKACLHRRATRKRPTLMRSSKGDGLLIDPLHRVVFIEKGVSVQLTPKEFELLRFLVENRGRVMSSDDILAHVWGPGYVGERDLVKQFIHRLRSKLEPDPSTPQSIVTIRGSGYAFEEETRPSHNRGASRASESVTPVRVRALSESRAQDPTLMVPSAKADVARRPGSIPRSAFWGRLEKAGQEASGLLVAWRRKLVLAALALAALAMLSVSEDALPGDTLYPVKTGLEDVQLAMAVDDIGDAELHLRFAKARLDEAASLLSQHRPEAFSASMAAFEDELRQANWIMARVMHKGSPRDAAIGSLLTIEMEAHSRALNRMATSAPEEARPLIDHALGLVNRQLATVQALLVELTPEATHRAPATTMVEVSEVPPSQGADTWLGLSGEPPTAQAAIATTSAEPAAGGSSGVAPISTKTDVHSQEGSPSSTPAPPTSGGAGGSSETGPTSQIASPTPDSGSGG
jgi:DNA-binding response OmpR family regulator